MIKENRWTYEEFKEWFEKNKENEPEIPFLLNGQKYMIRGIKNKVSFQRFGETLEEQSGEVYFKDLDTLYYTETIDGVLLKRDWDKILNFNDYYELL